jgi:hypothetical protein
MTDEATRAWADKHIWLWSQEDDGTWCDHPFPNEWAARDFEATCKRWGISTSRVAPNNPNKSS